MENPTKFPTIDFSQWEELNLPASGMREKKWLRNIGTCEIGLFKFPKTDDTGDFWAEKLAYEIGKLIDVNVAKTEIGIHNGRKGSFSYNVLNNGEYLVEGYSIIGDVLDFSTSLEIYKTIGINYSVELLENVLAERFPIFLKVILFDCLIGNTDRHHGNWAFITDENGTWLRLSPLYDNGSSLCYLERPERIKLMQKDKKMLEAALFSKAKSQIGLGGERPVNHFNLFSYICSKYRTDMKRQMEFIENNISDKTLSDILERFDDNIIDTELRQFIKHFLLKRREKMIDIFGKE